MPISRQAAVLARDFIIDLGDVARHKIFDNQFFLKYIQ